MELLACVINVIVKERAVASAICDKYGCTYKCRGRACYITITSKDVETHNRIVADLQNLATVLNKWISIKQVFRFKAQGRIIVRPWLYQTGSRQYFGRPNDKVFIAIEEYSDGANIICGGADYETCRQYVLGVLSPN